MEYVQLGRTGLKVSKICLGTMQFGWTTDHEGAFAVLDAYAEGGGNFIDTADIYSSWADDNPGGVSEKIIGEWMADRGNRRQLVVATKVRGRMWPGQNGDGLSRAHILQAVEDSLERLGVDAIDLYQLHWFDAKTPIEETLHALDDLVTSGMVHYLGCSNFPAWRLARGLWASDVNHWARFDTLQPHYNLVHRAEFERELMPLCADQGIGVLPYSPLQAGFLTGKYRRGEALPESARAARIQARYMTDPNWAVLHAMDEIARANTATIAQVALAWLLANPTVTAPIIGANTVAQLTELLPAADLVLAEEERARLDEASAWDRDRD